MTSAELTPSVHRTRVRIPVPPRSDELVAMYLPISKSLTHLDVPDRIAQVWTDERDGLRDG